MKDGELIAIPTDRQGSAASVSEAFRERSKPQTRPVYSALHTWRPLQHAAAHHPALQYDWQTVPDFHTARTERLSLSLG